MASSLWGHRQTEDENRQKQLEQAALTADIAVPEKTSADEIADFNGDMEVDVVGETEDIPEVEIPDSAKDETPKMGVGEHARQTIRQETGKKADEILKGGNNLFSKTMEMFGVSREGSAAALVHSTPFTRQMAKMDASREEKALERLRTQDYDDDEIEGLISDAGLMNQADEIKKITASSIDPINERRKLLSVAAEGELIERTKTREGATQELNRKEQTTFGQIASATLENSGYVSGFIYGSTIAGGLGIGFKAAEGASALGKIGVAAGNSVIGSAPTSAVSGMERFQRLSKKDYQLGAEDELQVIDNNYGELRAALQGGAGGIIENTVIEGLTDTAIELGCLGLAKIPGAQAFIVKPLQRLGNAAVRKMMGNTAGRALLRVGNAYNGISQFTHFESQPTEMLEENLTPIFDEVFGLDMKRGEHKGLAEEAKKYLDKTFSLATQKDIFYGLIGTCLLQAGAGGAGAAWAKRKAPSGGISAKEARSVLIDYANVPKEKVATLSDEEATAICDLYRTMSENPDKMVEFAEKIGAKAADIMDDVVNRAGAKMNRRLEAAGMSPSTFQIPIREENGKHVPDFKEIDVTDMVTGKNFKGRAVTDAESGVIIMDNGAGVGSERAFTVIDPLSKRSVDVPNLMLARKTASLFKNTAEMTKADRAAKQQYINNVWRQKYGNANIEQYDTIEQAVAASARHGVDIAAQEGFDPNRKAWHLKDGTIVFVRDNINSPYEIDTLFQHEIVGHNAEAMADEFMDNLDSQSMREAQETLGLTDEQMSDPRIKREVFANIIQQRRHNPSLMQKFKHFINEKRRAAGDGAKISDADVEVLAQQWEQAMMGDSGSMKSESAGTDMEFLDADGNPVGVEDADIQLIEEETNDETGHGADETLTQPEQGEESVPTEGEAARPVEGESERSETSEVVEKPVSSRSVIEKMTDKAPVQELPVSEVFNDDVRIPNFKEGANPETGEVEPLTGEPYDLVSNPIVVMEFKDGKKVVVTGRHRLALYKRSGRDKIAARVIREADGWTVNDAKMIDSIGNIIDEKGSVKDYVRYFEDAKPSREAAEAGGFLARAKGKLAFGIYESATEDTRSSIDWEGSGADGMISVEQAGIIAEAAPRNGHPRNKALQRILVAKALNGLRGKKLGILARSLAEEVKHQKNTGDVGGAMQLDLFSSAEDQALLAMEDKRADYRTRKSQEYGRIAEVLRTAMAKGGKLDLNEEYARELGITDPRDKKQLAVARDKAVERANYWENAIRLEDTDKTAMDAEIGASAKKTEEKKSQVADRLKAIRENKPKTPKNTPVSASAETAATTPKKTTEAAEARKTSESKPHRKSVILKDEKRAAEAKSQADDLMSLFASPELNPKHIENEEKYHSWAKKWGLNPTKEKNQREWAKKNSVMFASPEFDPEKFQQRVGAMAKLVSTLNKEGYNDFKSLASYLAENFPKEKFDAAKPYLRPVWNAVADAMELGEVSKKDAEAIYTEIEKSYNAPINEEKTDARDIQKPGRSDARQPTASPESPSEGDDSDAESQGAGAHSAQSGEGGAGTAVHDGAAGRPLLHVERPEMAVGAVSGGRAEDIGKGAEGSASVAGSDGRAVEGSRTGVGGSGSGVELGSGSSDNVEGRERSGGERVVETVRETLTEEAPNTVKNENYIITDADERAIEGGKPRDKVRANIEAIRIVRKLAEDGRDATPEEKTALARYVGWGGLRAAFNNTYYNAYEREQSEGTLPPQTWAAIRKTPLGEEGYDLYKQMRELLSQDEILSAENSTTSAFFTPIRLCRSIHKALSGAGLKDGRLLETSAGIGNLIGTGNYTNPRWTAIELDKVTGQILKALYPKANVRIQGFEDVVMPDNFMDAAISNVPFGTEHPFDPNYKKYGFVVHDFFFAKAIDKIHPGGVAAFITATGTLDKRDKSLIRYLSEHGGKIVGAVRIPNGFFAKNAGTDVATDVVFIQKVEGKADNSQFMETAEYKGCPISKYFIEHPELCMGRMVAGSNQFGQPELSYKAVDNDYSKIDEAVQKAAAGLEYKSVNELETVAPSIIQGFHNGLQNGNVGVVYADGKNRIVRLINGELQEVPKAEIPELSKPLLKKLVTPAKIVQGIESLRNAFRGLVDGQLANCSDEELKKLQDALNYEYTTFTSRFGALNSPLMQKFIRLDYAAAPLLLGMENVTVVDEGTDSKGNKKTSKVFSKADIFTKRTIFANPKATKADSVLDGMRISLNETGTVNAARIAELTGKDEETIKKELVETGLVFVNPETSGIETSDEYLSGSVRRKLKAAKAAAEIDPSFMKNVKALEEVQPEDIAATDVSYQLGQNWIPRDIYEQFFRETIYQNTAPRLAVTFDEREHLWHVDTKGRGQTEYDEESGLAVDDLLERTMNGRSIVVRRRISEDETVVDQEATTATKIVQEKIARAFQSWMTDDTARAERIERLYNDIMNDSVPRQFDTDVLELNGLSSEWAGRVGTKGREYQKRCIARGTFGGNLLIAHCVGAGKTFEMASICMQLRRLGIARKPMFAVPNHMLAQWNREFHEAYPGAKVLVADKKDLTKQNRRSFLARAANGDWDCIIVAHSSFSRIAMSPEHQAEYIEAELADLTDLLVRVENEKEKKKIRKQIQSKRDKLKALLDPSKKDDAIKFEELGCDYLFVDEAHNFKGIQINTHMSNVPGVTGSVSQRAQDLEMKCRYIAKLHGGDKGVVFATGTPISNSISEMYVMMRYLAPSKMDEMGVRSFDDWAKQFGLVVNEWSPNPSGVGFREKARFSQFQNVPEMKRFFRSFGDIVLDSELKIKRPYMIGGKPIQHILKPSAATKAYVQELNKRMERMQNEKVDPTEDNMLKVTTEGRLLAIDPMLIGVKDESHVRANACADEVKRIYDKSTGKPVTGRDGKPMEINGTQLIFCDSGVPKKKQFKQLVRTKSGNYHIASGYWTFTVTAPDTYGNRQLYGERTDGQRITFSPVTDHSIEGREDLASVYTALEALQTKAAAVNAENKPGKGVKKAKKPDGEPVDINNWLDLNSDAIGYDPRFSNPYAVENEEASDSTEEEDSADDKDTSEEANGDVEVDNMLRGKFNMYAELKKQLVRRGIPSEEIAFIHDAETMTQKQALFDKVKSGKIRVLIGNTAKMGEGTNVQDRLVAIHHLDIPWKPAWITQRDGRGIRSGNLNDEIGIHTYITEGTFDVYSWDTVGRKAKFIENAMNSRMDQRTIEDVDSTVMSLEEGKAAAAGDPRILERVKLIKDIEKAQMAFDTQVKAFDRSQLKMRVAENELFEAEKRVSREREAIDRYNAAKGDSPFTLTTMEEEPKALTENADLARYIQDRLGVFARKGSSVGIVGRLFGFDVRYESGEGTDRGHYMTIKEIGVRFPVTVLPGTGAAFPPSDLSKFKSEITRSTNPKYLESLDNYVEGYRKRLEVARKGVENAAGFDRDAASGKIGEMYHRLARLNKALGITDKTVRGIAAAHLRERRGLESENVAAALAAATPVEDSSMFADIPIEARLRIAEREMAEADFASPEFDPRNENSLKDIYDIITHETPDVAAKRLWDVLQETKDGRRRIRPYTTEEIIRGTQGHNNALGILTLVARATGESVGRNAFGGKGSWSSEGDDVQETRQRRALSKIAKGLGIYLEPSKLLAIISDRDNYIGRGQYSTVFNDASDDNFVIKVREVSVIAEDSDTRVEGGAVGDFDDILLSNAIFGEDFATTLIGVSEQNGHFYLILRQPKVDSIPYDREAIIRLRDYMTAKGLRQDDYARDSFENDNYSVTDLRLGANFGIRDGKIFPFDPISAFTSQRKKDEGVLFASPELDAKARIGITKRDLENQARRLGRVPWQPKKKTWPEIYQRSEAMLNQTGFIEELVADAARYARPLTAEQTLAVGPHILALGRQYEELRTLRQDVEHSIVEATRDNATTEDIDELNETLKQVKKEESEISKRYATAYRAMRMSKAEQGRALAANRGQFSDEFDFLGMKEARQSALGRDLTPEEMRQLHDICDRAKDLDEDARAELWAAVHAQAERTIKDLFMKDSVKRSGDSRKKKLVDYRKKYLDAMAHLKVWRDTVGGSLIGITGDEYGTWNRPLFDILLWHRFQNPDITAAQALQAVTQDVNTYITADDLTVARILTGFERSWDINRHDNVLKAGRDLRSQILTQLQIDSLLNKRMPGKTGPIPGEPSQELRDIRHTRDVLKNELEEETNDPRKLQGRMKRWMKWYDNRIEDLKREIAASERLPQTKRTLLWTEEMKQKRAEYEELIRERDRVCGKSGLSEEERIKRYEAQLERTLRRSVDRLLAARNDDFRRPDRPVAVTSDYIESLKKAIEDTNAEWRQEKRDRLMFGRTQAEINKLNENREKTRQKRIAYWQALTAPQADRSVVKHPQIPMPPEQQARYEELGQQMKRLRRQVMDMRAHDELMKKPWLWRHGVEYARFVNGLTRGFLATADHSAVLRQMAQLSLSHPKLAAQVFKNTIGTAFSDEKATRINAELLSDPRIKEAVDKGWLNWRNLEAVGNSGDVEMFSSLHSSAITVGRNADGTERRFSLDDIKGVGSVLRGSERIYATYINALSSEIYLALINADGFTAKLMFGQNGLTDFTKKEIAARINMANGSAQIDDAKKKQLMNQLTGIFWAPKLALSRLQLAVGWDVIHPLLDGSKDAKTRLRTAGFNAIEHARAKLAMIALGSLMLMLAGDDDDKEKLRRSSMFKQFLQVIKPRVGDTTLDFSGGEAGWYQLMSKWVTLEKETGTGKKVYLSDKDGHKQSFGADIMNDTFRFAQGKFNPLLSNAIAFWTGEDYVGQPFGLGDFALNTFVPLGASDMTEMFVENGLGRGLLLAPFVIFGAGGNTYKVKRYEIAVNQFTEAAKEYDAIREDGELSSDERSDLLSEMEESIPELKSRGRIEGKIKNVKYFESEIRKVQKSGGAVPKSLTDGLERAKKETLETIREARKTVDNG